MQPAGLPQQDDAYSLRAREAALFTEDPLIDHAAIEAALRRHMECLGLPAPWHLRWENGLVKGLLAAYDLVREKRVRARERARGLLRSATWDARWCAMFCDPSARAIEVPDHSWIESVQYQIERAARADAQSIMADRDSRSSRRQHMWTLSGLSARDAATDMFYRVPPVLLATLADDLGSVEREAYLALFEAAEAGLYGMWVLGDGQVIAVERPGVSLVAGQLHAEGRPAVIWPSPRSPFRQVWTAINWSFRFEHGQQVRS